MWQASNMFNTSENHSPGFLVMSVQCFLDAFFLQWYATLQIFQPPWVFRLNSSSPFQNKLIIIWGTAPWTQVLNMETFRFVSWNKVTKKNYQYYCGLCNTAWPCNALTIFVLCMPHWLPCNSCASIWNRKSCLDLFSCTFFLKVQFKWSRSTHNTHRTQDTKKCCKPFTSWMQDLV